MWGNNDSNDKDIHVHFLWDHKIEGIEHGQVLHLPERTGKVCQEFSYQMLEKGAYVMLNHPHWSMLTSPEVDDENPYHAVEIINYDTEWLEITGDSTVFWTEMLYRGVRMWAAAMTTTTASRWIPCTTA